MSKKICQFYLLHSNQQETRYIQLIQFIGHSFRYTHIQLVLEDRHIIQG